MVLLSSNQAAKQSQCEPLMQQPKGDTGIDDQFSPDFVTQITEAILGRVGYLNEHHFQNKNPFLEYTYKD
jgi:hypothetical protein